MPLTKLVLGGGSAPPKNPSLTGGTWGCSACRIPACRIPQRGTLGVRWPPVQRNAEGGAGPPPGAPVRPGHRGGRGPYPAPKALPPFEDYPFSDRRGLLGRALHGNATPCEACETCETESTRGSWGGPCPPWLSNPFQPRISA